MIQPGILEKVTHGGSDWASPRVAIKKTDEDIRYVRIRYPYRVSKLPNKKYFEKIDLKSANNHIEIDSKFKEITTLNTPMRLLRWSCLPFGIKTASHIFQIAIEKILLRKVDNIIIYQDDICMGARTKEALKSKIKQVLRRLTL